MSHLSLAKFWIIYMYYLYINIHIHTHLPYDDYTSNYSIQVLDFFCQYLQNRLLKKGGSVFHVMCVCFVFQTKLKTLLPGPCPCPNGELLRKGRKIGALVKGSSTADIPQTTQPDSGKHCCANCHHQRLITKMQIGVCRAWKAASKEEGQHWMLYQGRAGWLTLAGLTAWSTVCSCGCHSIKRIRNY